VQLARTGDWNAALRAGGDKSAGEYTVTTYTQHGLSFAPGAKVAGTGFNMERGAAVVRSKPARAPRAEVSLDTSAHRPARNGPL
jgi:hypothetical protein